MCPRMAAEVPPAPTLRLRWMLGWQIGGLLLIAALIAGSLLPPIAIMVARGEDKVLHAVAYGALSLYYAGLIRPRYYILIAVGLMGLGIAIELLQRRIGYRVADTYDVVANAAGIVAGLVLALAGLRRWACLIEARFSGYHRPGSGPSPGAGPTGGDA